MSKKTLKDYPHNWKQISHRIKIKYGFQCQGCGLQFKYNQYPTKMKLPTGKLRRLTVHHKDRNTKNNAETNLIALCCACHCKTEWPLIRAEQATKKTQLQKNQGQQFFFENDIIYQ